MFDIITIGGATRDITFLTDKGRVIETPKNLAEQSLLAFEYGAKIKSDEVYFNFGGGACNTAATLSKLGIKVAVNCRIGEDENGLCIMDNFKKLGINNELVQTDNKRETGFSLVVVNKNEKGGDRVIFVYKGASEFLEVKEDNIRRGKWIYLASLAGKWEESLEIIEKTIKENGIKLAWNPGEAQIIEGKTKLRSLMKQTEVFIVNKDEAIELVQSDESLKLDFNEINNCAILAGNIKKWGPSAVVVTDGKNGAYVSMENNKVAFAPATSQEKVDSTGAGDAFGSALVGGYMLTGDIEKALKYGVLNSGGVVSEYGAQNGLLNRSEIEEKLDSVKVSWL